MRFALRSLLLVLALVLGACSVAAYDRAPARPADPHVRAEVAAQVGLARAHELLADETVGLVVLDEIFGAVTANLIGEADVVALLDERGPETHVVMTGRAAPPAVIELADLAAEVRLVKHPCERGTLAQRDSSSS